MASEGKNNLTVMNKKLHFLLIYLLLIFPFKVLCATDSYISRQEIGAGTFIRITIQKGEKSAEIFNEAFSKIKEMEKIFSVYDSESEISCLNRQKKLKVSNELLFLLKKSLYISSITKGAFDVTCKPLTDLYKRAKKRNYPPSDDEIQDVLKHIGWQNIRIENNYVEIPEHSEIDFGGIAKGYIVDKTVNFLKEKGIKNGMVNAGGEIFAFGNNPHGKNWQIGIRDPFSNNGIIKKIRVKNFGVATSGNYENFFSIRGKKYGHIINPVTGRTVQDFPVSVTVIAPDCTTADALATAFFVLGGEKSLTIADSIEGIDVFIIDGNRKIYESKNFSHLVLP